MFWDFSTLRARLKRGVRHWGVVSVALVQASRSTPLPSPVPVLPSGVHLSSGGHLI